MGAFVQPAGLEIKAHQPHRVGSQRALRGFGERALRHLGVLVRLSRLRVADQARQPLAQITKQGIHRHAAHARLVLVEQGVVAAQSRALGQALRLLPRQPHELAQIDQVAGPVIDCALGAPRMFAARNRQRFGFHQLLRQRIGGTPAALHFTQIGLLAGIQGLDCRLGQQARQRGLGGQLMQQAAHLGQGLRARLIALAGHIGRLVPLRDGLQMAQPVQALMTLVEVLVSRDDRVHAANPNRCQLGQTQTNAPVIMA